MWTARRIRGRRFHVRDPFSWHDLTHLHLEKVAAISQTIFSDAFSWMKIIVLWLKFHWSSWRPSWQYLSIGFDNGLVPNRRQAFIWTNADLTHWCIYVALGGDELTGTKTCISNYSTVFYGMWWLSHAWTSFEIRHGRVITSHTNVCITYPYLNLS